MEVGESDGEILDLVDDNDADDETGMCLEMRVTLMRVVNFIHSLNITCSIEPLWYSSLVTYY